jgi:hypothetical protein
VTKVRGAPYLARDKRQDSLRPPYHHLLRLPLLHRRSNRTTLSPTFGNHAARASASPPSGEAVGSGGNAPLRHARGDRPTAPGVMKPWTVRSWGQGT